MMHLTTTTLPLWLAHLSHMAMIGHGSTYKETGTRLFVCIKPTEAEMKRFSYLDGVEEVFLVYERNQHR